MILILSIPTDQTTNEVIKWLIHFGIEWERIDRSQVIKIEEIKLANNIDPYFLMCISDGRVIDSRQIRSYWYRRSDIQFAYDTELKELLDESLRTSLTRHMKVELQFLKTGIHALLSETPSLNDFRTAELNKIEVLLAARKVGLHIPETLITNSKCVVEDFMTSQTKMISKAIQRGHRFPLEKEGNSYEYLCYTEEFTLDDLSEEFFPSLFQEMLDKEIELRIFFLCGDFYSMAIDSQNDDSTIVDFRNYNMERPNRNTPVKLPNRIEKKLTELMKGLKLNSGSIDMILTKKHEYVFLEVNSIGQFSMVSNPCHFNLFEKVAQVLITPNEWMIN